MKSFIFAGGLGTRISEMTDKIPKPMIPIGKWPILSHIMSHYSKFGIREFTILAGYKHEVIDDYFSSGPGYHLARRNAWKVEVIDTGEETTTAGRIWFVRDKLPAIFMLTYGDGLADIDVNELIKVHLNSRMVGTVTAVRPPARFGTIEFDSGIVTSFREKDPQRTGWINGGFFCFENKVLDYISDTSESFESSALEALTESRQLGVYAHTSFWHPMDTLRDMRSLNKIFSSGDANWDSTALE
jgi:glucose-1-phosphate cytidylyltransferase